MLRCMVSWLCSKSVGVKTWHYHSWQQEEMLFQLCKHAVSYAKSEMNWLWWIGKEEGDQCWSPFFIHQVPDDGTEMFSLIPFWNLQFWRWIVTASMSECQEKIRNVFVSDLLSPVQKFKKVFLWWKIFGRNRLRGGKWGSKLAQVSKTLLTCPVWYHAYSSKWNIMGNRISRSEQYCWNN